MAGFLPAAAIFCNGTARPLAFQQCRQWPTARGSRSAAVRLRLGTNWAASNGVALRLCGLADLAVRDLAGLARFKLLAGVQALAPIATAANLAQQ